MTPPPSSPFSWLYRIHPSAKHLPFQPLPQQTNLTNDFSKWPPNPNQVYTAPCLAERKGLVTLRLVRSTIRLTSAIV